MATIRARIRAATDRRNVGKRLETVVEDLGGTLAAWGTYFRSGNSGRRFRTIDRFVHERLAIFMSRKHGRPGRQWGRRYNTAWLRRLGVYRLSGTVRYRAAHALR